MGKIKKHTEYYCDICDRKILYGVAAFVPSGFYKIKGYNYDGRRDKPLDYEYVCRECMYSIVKKVREERKENKNEQ